MNTKQIRNWIFYSHRILGLVVGLVLVITGVTGTALVFQHEIVAAQTVVQYGRVVPQGALVAPETIANTVRSTFADRPDFQLLSLLRKPNQPDAPYRATLRGKDKQLATAWVNPYTGEIMGTFLNQNTWVFLTFKLHYTLLAGDNGKIVMGWLAALSFVLCVTGIALWSGWRKLSAGFRIKWNGSPQRLNFELHNVGGIVVAVFLSFTALTGFVWNLDLNPAIYAATGTVDRGTAKSQPSDRPPIRDVMEILNIADAALPGAVTTEISFPQQPTDAYRIRKKFPTEDWHFGRSLVFVDRFSGQVVQVKDGSQPNLGDRILNTFVNLHYGTFGGLITRILYIFVGLAPLLLFITGAKMFKMRTWDRSKRKVDRL